MKIDRKKLQKIIREELTRTITEADDIYGDFGIGGMKSGKPFQFILPADASS